MQEVGLPQTRYVDLEKLTGLVLGANILRLDITGFEGWICQDPRVLRAKVKVDPVRLRVDFDVWERDPAIAVGVGDHAVWVDRQGVVLEEAEGAAVVGVAVEGGRVPQGVVEAALAWDRLPKEMRFLFPALDVSDPRGVVLRGAATVLLGSISQVPPKLVILRGLWQEGLLERCEWVDLRREDEVVLKRTQ